MTKGDSGTPAPLFPDVPLEDVLAATERRWDTSRALPVPRPGWLACPVCRGEVIQPRFWRFHERDGRPTTPWRCDVSFKCCDCAAVWIHGVALPAETWAGRPNQRVNRQIQWRDARRLLEED